MTRHSSHRSGRCEPPRQCRVRQRPIDDEKGLTRRAGPITELMSSESQSVSRLFIEDDDQGDVRRHCRVKADSFRRVGRGGGVHPMMLKKCVLSDGIFCVIENRARAAFLDLGAAARGVPAWRCRAYARPRLCGSGPFGCSPSESAPRPRWRSRYCGRWRGPGCGASRVLGSFPRHWGVICLVVVAHGRVAVVVAGRRRAAL